jgi:hypothetical protein
MRIVTTGTTAMDANTSVDVTTSSTHLRADNPSVLPI